ncbi:MAG: methionyl aminopeptidase [Lachnospiraceae bacterium]|nr:methionyl aminopeptidase [Lachnospiraceae bacterium]
MANKKIEHSEGTPIKKLGRNEPCWCGSGKKYKTCHEAFDDKILAFKRKGFIIPDREQIKTKEQIEGIRISGLRNIAILDEVAKKIHIGMSTQEIDDIVASKTEELGGTSATLGYQGFPKSVCTSINSQVCHGIPYEKDILTDGDIVNVDFTTIYNGYYSDSSRTFLLGNVKEATKKLVEVAKECMNIGVAAVKPWTFLGDMGNAVNEHAKKNGYSIVRDIGGHGVGLDFHEEPWVSYVSKPGEEMLMVPGMVFTIEPMVNMGRCDVYVDEENEWTVYTDDGRPSAQWEVTVAVTEDGAEILAY